jgi:hypothetical protein
MAGDAPHARAGLHPGKVSHDVDATAGRGEPPVPGQRQTSATPSRPPQVDLCSVLLARSQVLDERGAVWGA